VSATAAEKRAAVLVADDMSMVRRPLRLFLERRGYRVFEADNGSAALETLAKESIDAALLDLDMPVMDGFAVLEALGPRRPPVIVMTAHATRAYIERALALGASEVLIKASQPLGEVVERIEALVSRGAGRAPA
jgi:CheY-like chemotaxis protein